MQFVIWLLLIVFCSTPAIVAEIISRNLTESQLNQTLATEEVN